MKKILLFLFVMILTTIKINADALPNNYSIKLYQSPENYEVNAVKGTRINSTLYQLFNVDFYGEHYVSSFSDSTITYYTADSDTRFHLVETAQSEGFYENVPLDLFFDLTPTCPHIIIDVKKKVKEYNLRIVNKKENPTYYYVYNSSGELITKNLLFGGTNEFVVPYDNYRFKTGYGDITINNISYDYFRNTLMFENDSLGIYNSEIKIETPYILNVTITKQCIDDEGEFYNVPIEYNIEEDSYGNETYNQTSSEIDLHNVQLDNPDSFEIISEEIVNETDNLSNDIDIVYPDSSNIVEGIDDLFEELNMTNTIPNLNEDIKLSNELIKKEDVLLESNQNVKESAKNKVSVKTKKESEPQKLINQVNNQDQTMIEELESNLIIESSEVKNTNSNPKTKVKKASNIPVIIIGLLPFFLILVVKIIKKVQKN